MTLEEAIIEVYEGSDEQNDLNPYNDAGAVDIARPETVRILRALQRGMNTISTWKFRNGVRLRFRVLEQVKYFSTTVYESTVSSLFVPGAAILPIPTLLDGSDNKFVDWVVSLADGRTFTVIASGPTTMALSSTIDDDIIGTTFKMYQRFVQFGDGDIDWDLGSRLMVITKITNMSNQTDLAPKNSSRFTLDLATVNSPTEYAVYNNGIMFSSAPESSEIFRIMFLRYPNLPSGLDVHFELPDNFHEAIVIWAKKWALERIGEIQRGYALWNLFEELLMAARTEVDIESDVIDYKLYPRE